MKLTRLAAILGLALSGAATAAPDAPSPAPDYSQDSSWLCLPDRADACGTPLPTTALGPDGYGARSDSVPAKDPPIDCFYVYPTVSRDPGLNSDMAAGAEEPTTAAVQFARFASVCKTYAPLYRQVTLAALPRTFAGENLQANFDLAYGDVVAAWHEFLAHRGKDRPFVLIGHSQGSVHLERLIAEEIDGKPLAKRMVSALLLGWAVDVPPGKTVGGSFKSVPLCTKGAETGCVVSYMTFRESSPPPADGFLGLAAHPGMTAGCTNPAKLAGDGEHLDSYWFTKAAVRPGQKPIIWSSQGEPPTPFVHTEGLVSAHCAHDGKAGWLALKVNADPKDARTDAIPGDVYMFGTVNPSWGTHIADMSVAQGNLVRLVGQQARAWRPAP